MGKGSFYNAPKKHENPFGPKVVGFKQQGVHKKIANVSISQLRTMFPDLAYLGENELRREATKRLLER